jgi:hypothetical protein
MVNYQTIATLVNQIPADTWEVLREIKERRPAMMLSELTEDEHRNSRSFRSDDRRQRAYLTRARCNHVDGSIDRIRTHPS